MKKSQIKLLRIMVIFCFLVTWFYWDFSQAGKHLESIFPSYKANSEYDTITSATTKVSIVRSNDDSLAHPVAIDDANIDYQTMEEMVRRAINLAGGFTWVIKTGDMVLLKPNIVDPEPPGTGEVTDVRVIKALIKIIDEIDPGNIEIVIGEGSPREMDYELAYSNRTTPRWEELWDVAGYQDLLTDPYLEGINFRLSNLNGSPAENPWQDLVLVDVPGGGEALHQGGKYWIHKDILNADVFITVPVMKIHSPGITVALKNQIGIAPSTKYGFSKTDGIPQDNYATKLIHQSLAPMYWTDKEIVDLCNLAQIDFVVVDAIACLETKKSATRSGNTITNFVRMNTIVAGADPVAVDHVCTRLMGMNPDDIEHITLAEKVGLGTNDPDYIEITGADLHQTMKRFKKSLTNEGRFGQGNRLWLLKGTYSAVDISDAINHEFIPDEANVVARANEDGWSEPIYFNDDHINLANYYNLDLEEVVSYVFCYFDAPADQEVELWLGSDEAVKIYINHQEVYSYSGTRSFPNDEFLSEKVMINIKEGENKLLVKSYQRFSRYDFCLNICEPESDPIYDGNRVWGLKFKTESNITAIEPVDILKNLSYKIHKAYPNPFNSRVTMDYQISTPGYMDITVYNIRGQKVRTLFEGDVPRAGNQTIAWDGKNSFGSYVSSGLYLITIQQSGNPMISEKVLFVK
jgi:uncharacterized protein (DUF362 family)